MSACDVTFHGTALALRRDGRRPEPFSYSHTFLPSTSLRSHCRRENCEPRAVFHVIPRAQRAERSEGRVDVEDGLWHHAAPTVVPVVGERPPAFGELEAHRASAEGAASSKHGIGRSEHRSECRAERAPERGTNGGRSEHRNERRAERVPDHCLERKESEMEKEGRVNLHMPVELKRRIQTDFNDNIGGLCEKGVMSYNMLIVAILTEVYYGNGDVSISAVERENGQTRESSN